MNALRLSCKCGLYLILAVLASGTCGALFGVQPALASGSPLTVSSQLIAQPLDGSAFVVIDENGDGTAATFIGFYVTPTLLLNFGTQDNTNFTISSDFKPGQSGHGSGTGTGHFEYDDVPLLDLVTYTYVGSYHVSVDVEVVDADNIEARISQGVTTQIDPFSSDISIVREHIRGSQAWSDTAASLSVFLDDGSGSPGLALDLTGVYGMVGASTVHDVEHIH